MYNVLSTVKDTYIRMILHSNQSMINELKGHVCIYTHVYSHTLHNILVNNRPHIQQWPTKTSYTKCSLDLLIASFSFVLDLTSCFFVHHGP
jgi:hypothetical protein